MTRTITGLFDTREAAEAVISHLVTHDGVDRSRITLHGNESTTSTATTGNLEHEGFWASLKSLFVPEEDRYAYSEGIRRGGYLLAAELDEDQVAHAMDVFEDHGAVDLDAREQEWRSSGWQGYQPDAASLGGAGVTSGLGADMSSGTGERMSSPLGTSTTIGSSLGGVSSETSESRLAAADTSRTDQEGVIPIVQETLRVGKRDAEHGRVRVRSYVVETPVTEQVSLRQEHVEVQRRAVDRPLTDTDGAFREQTIEAVERREEAVVSKEARVVEEVVINKDATEHTETVQDTVRRQDVEVEDTRGTTQTTGPAGTTLPGGKV
jgi:uncharacterized protein (TIGR02271 family)